MADVYLAARFGRWPEMQEHTAELEALGHRVVSRWHGPANIHQNAHHDATPTPAQQAAWAEEDVEDLWHVQWVLSFTEQPRSAEGGRGGRHVEFGIALAFGRRCVIIGPAEHVFHRLPKVEQFDGWEHFIASITEPAVLADCGA